jgi:methyl-accepting chemotaxis protein
MAQSRATLALNVACDLIKEEGAEQRIEAGSLFAGSPLLNARNHTVDRIGAVGGGVTTIFAGEPRVATSRRPRSASRGRAERGRSEKEHFAG